MDDYNKKTGEGLSEANRSHWDALAPAYFQKPWIADMTAYVHSQIQRNLDIFDVTPESASTFRLLDYACGPGSVTDALGKQVKSVVAVDLSAGMIAEYEKRMRGREGLQYEVYQGDLLAASPYLIDENGGRSDEKFLQEEQWNDFDVVVVGFGFHHFEDYAGVLRKLGERCKSGGAVVIIDLLPKHDHHASLSDDMKKMMHVSGFDEQTMKKFMDDAGLVDFKYAELPDEITMAVGGGEKKRKVFFARGRRA